MKAAPSRSAASPAAPTATASNTVTGNEPGPNPDNNSDNTITKVDCIPLIDPILGAAAALLALGSTLLLRNASRRIM